MQELPPRRVGVSLRSRRDLQRFEDPADRRRADPVTELEQLTLDPLVSPAVVLGGEALDQRNNLPADRRSACSLWIRPFPGNQATVPSQDGPGSDQPVCPQLAGQEPDQRGHDGSAGPVEPGGAECGAARRSRAAAPAAPHSWTLTSGQAGPASRRAERRSGRAGEGTRPIIMPYGLTMGHRRSSQAWQTSGTPPAWLPSSA